MNRSRWFQAVFLAVMLPASSAAAQEIELWPDGRLPFAKPHEIEEKLVYPCWGGVRCLHDVVIPTLKFFEPGQRKTDQAVLIMPGGGYDAVAMFHEGSEIAEVLNEQGIPAAVLKYRLPDPRTSDQPWNVTPADLERAMEIMRDRQQARDYGSIGLMGFSASGHLATWYTHRPRTPEPLKPDFLVLAYGATMMMPVNLEWLRDHLYHRPMTEEEICEHNLETHLSVTTPPTFLVHAMDDELSPPEESTLYAARLSDLSVEVELLLFEKGGHGFGPGRESDGTDQWLLSAARWISAIGED